MEIKLAGEFCPLCSGYGNLIGTKDSVLIRECSNGHAPVLLSWAWNSESDYDNFYAEDGVYHQDEQKLCGQSSFWSRDTEHIKAAAVRLDTLNSVYGSLTGKSIVDIGAGTGAFVVLAGSCGAHAIGFEPNGSIVVQANEIGRNIIRGQWNNVSTKYHIITMWDVFEHLTRPSKCLVHVQSKLLANGILVIEIPEWGCPEAIQYGIDWKHCRPRQHLFLPSNPAAIQYFESCGLKVEAIIRPLRGTLGKIQYFLSCK